MDEKMREELKWAYDFDPRDPKLGMGDWSCLSSKKINRRTMLRILAGTGMLPFVAHLLGPLPAWAQPGKPGGELKAAWNVKQFDNLDPAFINQVVQFQVASNVLSGLTHINRELIPKGDLAEGWDVSRDGKTWTFFLRKGVLFHNGDKFTADDVIFTWKRSQVTGIQKAVIAEITDMKKVDDFTLQIILKVPKASFLVKTTERSSGRALTVVNKRAIETLKEGHTLTPVGTGPFKVVEHRLGELLVLERFKDYFIEGQPLLDKITIFNVEEAEPLARALEVGAAGGGVDFVNVPPIPLIKRLEANPDLVIDKVSGPGFQSIIMHNKKGAFTDQRVRLAVAKAIQRDELIEKALFGNGIPAFGPVPPAQGLFFFDMSKLSPQAFDPEGAKKLLAEAGFDGKTKVLKFSAMTTPIGRRAGEIHADILKKNAGIEMELEVLPFPTLIARLTKEEYEAALVGSGGDFDPDDSIDDWFASGTVPGTTKSKFNTFGYSNPRLDELNEAQKAESNVQKRIEIVQAISKILTKRGASSRSPGG